MQGRLRWNPVRGLRWAVGAGGMLLALAAAAETFLVTSTADSGAGSLRQAILDANTRAGSASCPPQTIEFSLPGSGVRTIRPTSALPSVQIPIFLNGYSQPGAKANTLYDGSDAVLLVELDGSLAGNVSGLALGPPVGSFPCGGQSSEISGLVINRFQQAGIAIDASACPSVSFCNVHSVSVNGSYIGVDASGLVALGNGYGVVLGTLTANNRIGTSVPDGGASDMPSPTVRNVIAGNHGPGIVLTAGPVAGVDTTSANQNIRGNFIGVGADGRTLLANDGAGIAALEGAVGVRIQHNLIAGNHGHGVLVVDDPDGHSSIQANAIGVALGGAQAGNSGDGVHIGGLTRGAFVGGYYPLLGVERASIAHNSGAGVMLVDRAIVDVSNASIGGNVGLAIDLAPLGPTDNDALDAHDGPNELLNHPLLTLASAPTPSDPAHIEGSLHADPFTSYEIGLYISDGCGPFGRGELQRRLPANLALAQTDATGNGSFATEAAWMPAGRYITAVTRAWTTREGPPAMEVSEPSPCLLVSGDERIFFSGFELP